MEKMFNRSRLSFTLIEIMISSVILTFFLTGVYSLYGFISKTAAHNAFVEQISMGETKFSRYFMNVMAQSSLPAVIIFPKKPSSDPSIIAAAKDKNKYKNVTDIFRIEENKNYCLYLRGKAVRPKKGSTKIEPILDVYECTSEKLEFPISFPVQNRGLKIKRIFMVLNSKGEIILRTLKLPYDKFYTLKSKAPSPQNTDASYFSKYDQQNVILERVMEVSFTIKETDTRGWTKGRDDDIPGEQKLKIRVIKARGERFNTKSGVLPPGSFKDIEYSFIPQVPVKKLAF
ncbi:PilW family protein [Candidatus Riflebacteria bacterium]